MYFSFQFAIDNLQKKQLLSTTIAFCSLPIHAKINKVPKRRLQLDIYKISEKLKLYASKTQPKAILLKNRTFWLEKIT